MRSLHDLRGSSVSMLLVALLSVALLSVALLNHPAHGGEGGGAPPRDAIREANRDPANRCERARMFGPDRPLSEEEAIRLLDGDPHTGVHLMHGGAHALSIHFQGAPRWFNRVAILASRKDLTVEYYDVDRQWRTFGEMVEERPADGTVQWDGAFARARGLRIILPSLASEGSPVFVAEISATSAQVDPDDEDALLDVSGWYFHSDYSNDYPGTSDDMDNRDDDALGVWNALPSSWDLRANHWDQNAYEEHIKRHDLGGENGSHVDYADLAYLAMDMVFIDDPGYDKDDVAGILWGDLDHDDGYSYPSEAQQCWGDTDLEWMAMSISYLLSWGSLTNYSLYLWDNAFAGAHMICGTASALNDWKYGKTFGDRLVDDGWGDSAKDVMSAWCDAMDRGIDANQIAVMSLESNNFYDDYIWGEGSGAAADVTPDSWTWNYYWNSGSALAPDDPDASSRRMSREELHPGEWRIFPAAADRGFDVAIPREELERPGVNEMPIYIVDPVQVDSSLVRQVANTICPTVNALCDGQVGPGDPGEINLIDGVHELRVSVASGAIQYENTQTWLTPRPQPPNLLLDQAAIDRASQVLTSWQRRPADAVPQSVDYLWQSKARKVTGETVADSTFPLATRVIFRRQLGQAPRYPVVGAGGVIKVSLGEGGEIQRVYEGGWRPVHPGSTIPIRPVEQVIQDLSVYGWDAITDPYPLPVESIDVLSWELAYREPGWEVNVNAIIPVYVLHTQINLGGGNAVQLDLFAFADFPQVVAQITSPPDGTTVPPGQEVCLEGTATGGDPPYTFRWLDDLGNPLGLGPQVCAVLPTPPDSGDGSGDWVRTVTLVAQDSRGRADNAYVTIVLSDPAEVEGPTVTSELRIHSIHPNPFRLGSSISLEIPSGGAERSTSLRIFDASGRRVRTLIDGFLRPGVYRAYWDGRNDEGGPAASGVYFYRLQRGSESRESRIVLIR